jgi:hypothetical protein
MFKKALRRTWRRHESPGNDNAKKKAEATDTLPQKQQSVVITEVPYNEAPSQITSAPTKDVAAACVQQKQSVSAPVLRHPENISSQINSPPTNPKTNDSGAKDIPEFPVGLTLSPPGSKALYELQRASEQFTHNYERFLAKNNQFLTLDREIDSAIQIAEVGEEISYSATLFKKHISNVLEVNHRKDEHSQSKWPSKVGRLLSALYPVVKITIGVTTTVAEVCRIAMYLNS